MDWQIEIHGGSLATLAWGLCGDLSMVVSWSSFWQGGDRVEEVSVDLRMGLVATTFLAQTVTLQQLVQQVRNMSDPCMHTIMTWFEFKYLPWFVPVTCQEALILMQAYDASLCMTEPSRALSLSLCTAQQSLCIPILIRHMQNLTC